MASDSRTSSSQKLPPTKRQEKAQRILDAAAELVLRWGYDKTTMDDIARQAGVAKGTLYLYWKTREDLFRALFWREGVEVGEDIRQRLAEDPLGATLRGIYRNAALAYAKRPLMKAVLLRDRDVLGKLAHSIYGTPAYAEKLGGFNVYLEFLRERDLIRKDISPRAQVATVTAIFMGFFLTAPLLPDELGLADEEMADLIGEVVHRTLETDRPVALEEYQTVFENFMTYYDRIMATAREQLRQELESST